MWPISLEEVTPGALERSGWGAHLRQALEASNLALLGRLLLRMALLREESRGAHFREDFPQEGKEAYHLEAQGSELRRVPTVV
jgi:L-aspartate oxidase